MSSQTDMEALDAANARVARLQAQLVIQQEESASRISDLEQKVTDLRVELHLAAEKPKDPAPQPTVSTGSSDPVLRAEISQLQQVLASKDAVIASRDREILLKDADIASRDMEISLRDADIELKNAEIETKDAEIERLCWNTSDLIQSVQSCENGLNAMARELRRARGAVAAVIDDLHPKESTPKIEVTDADRSSKQASTSPHKDVKDEGETKPKTPSSNSAPKDVKGEGETKPKTPSFGFLATKVPANAAPAPPYSEKPTYSQALKNPKASSSFGNRAFPPIARQGGFSGTRARTQQTPPNQPKQKQSVTRRRAPKRAPRRGEQTGCEGQGLERGLTSHDSSPKVHYPLTPRQAAPTPTRETMSTDTKGASANKSADQLSRKSDIDLSVATSKLQIGQEAPVHENKDDPSRVTPKVASNAANTVFDNAGNAWDAWKFNFYTRLTAPIPPEVRAAVESGALLLSTASDVEDDPSVSSDYDTASLNSTDPAAQELETEDAGPSEAAPEGDKAVPKPEQPAAPDSQRSSNAPAQKPGTGDAGPSKATREGDKVVPKPLQPAIPDKKLTPFQQSGEFGSFGKAKGSNTKASIFSSMKWGSKSTSESSHAQTSTTMTDESKTGPKPSTTAENPAMRSSFQSALGQEAGESSSSKTGHQAQTSQAGD